MVAGIASALFKTNSDKLTTSGHGCIDIRKQKGSDCNLPR
ncbi:uncharacterized protein PgNI_04392 [Pyricularia grisea]|uniref:Uncharacterized protein n=1 Tax=Pyricularia grisea TaxID=148305 RepID=A0A6P8BAZ4_PYRGI|nr:uncharacterized protein PgNI_04392 [Pyricularia grisea]TLD12979.1 hypothetical protein PgNI_04392 [Pyricularia grisea]